MEDNGDAFPEADFLSVLTKIKKGASTCNNLQEYAIQLMKALDPKG